MTATGPPRRTDPPATLAVIGSGVAGLTAAYVARTAARVTLYEADARLGGHAHTHTVSSPSGDLAVDTGFIVHNERTYPTLLRLFSELGVQTQPAEMSLSFRSGPTQGDATEWAGGRGLAGLFPTWRDALRPEHLRMLAEILRFHRHARRLLRSPEGTLDPTLAEFVTAGGFSGYFERHFLTPLVATVWSCDPALAGGYPARYLFRFLDHHGMLAVRGSPQWRTVVGGSVAYVGRIAQAITASGGEVRPDTKVTGLAETPTGVAITDSTGETQHYDAAVVAVHPGQALDVLTDPTAAQREVLGAMPYSHNLAQLHTDTSLLPRHRRAWASWNHLERADRAGVVVTYDLTRLMRLPSADGVRYLVTLGAADLVDPATVLATMDYAHPLYTRASVAAQRRLPDIDSERIAFAGAWHGWGFHEDGARAGAAAVARLGLPWTSPRPAPANRIYRTTVSHTRRGPVRHRFTRRSHLWLVDLDRLPDHGILGRFEARDHLGDPDATIRTNLDAFLAGHRIARPARVLMAAHPRALGYCFNPISVFWCTDAAQEPLATVAEVHNTYGDRHAYLLRPACADRVEVAKQMYVSPFHGTDGRYEIVAPPPGDRIRVAVRLRSDDGLVFDAALHGTPINAGLVRAAAAGGVDALVTRMHGIWLWARGLPVRPRPVHHQEGVR